MTDSLFVRGLRLGRELPEGSYVAELPVVRFLHRERELMLHRSVTFLVGENGMGKSTLLEAAAVALGFNPEGGDEKLPILHPGHPFGAGGLYHRDPWDGGTEGRIFLPGGELL